MKQLLFAALAIASLLAACKKNDKPGMAVVNTVAPTNITSSGAQIGGTITSSGNSPISQSGVCWAFQNTPTLGDSVVPSGTTSTGAFSVSLSNLNANTLYYVRAFVTNGIGTSYGAVDSFTTGAGVPTVTTAAISNNAALAAVSGGNITNNGGSSVTASGVCWSTSPNPTVSSAKTVGSAATGSFVDTLENLTLGNTYYVRAYATNSFGTAYGSELNFVVSSTGTVTDYDGNTYPTVTIGNQTWMASNLRVTHYQNGDPVYNAFGDATFSWYTTTNGAYTFVNVDSAEDSVMAYGLLYNNLAVDDNRNIAPAGWHVATVGDWETMEFTEGMPAADTVPNMIAGTIGSKLLVGGSSGLNLQLSGFWYYTESVSYNLNGYFWTSSLYNASYNYEAEIYGPTSPNYQKVHIYDGEGVGLSVRCVKN